MEISRMTCSDGKELSYRSWFPENNNIHSIVHIFHGMAEHSARYDRFATYLNSLGIAVYAQDHRGHGMTASDDELGWFADKHGWQRVLDDGHELDQFIASQHPGKDLFLFGHSMGSFLCVP
jgi:alpha-beta hydrolase superfamily lysophospholipase